MTLTIDKFGRVLIPKPLRQHLMIEPGDEVKVLVDDATKSIVLSAKTAPKDAEVVYTDWGLPMVKPAGEFPKNFDGNSFLKETYDEHFKRSLGL